MAFQAVVENLDDLPENVREHYIEVEDKRTGKKVFVPDIAGDTNLLPVTRSLRDEAGRYRTQLRDVEQKYGKIKAFEGMDPTEVLAKMDRIAELEAANGGKLDEKQLETLVETRIKTKTGPLERQIQTLMAENTELKTQVDGFKGKERSRKITDAVREAATQAKMQPEAIEDAIMYAERVMDVDEEGRVSVKESGLAPRDWLMDMQPKRPHWWGPSVGGGSRGNAGTFGDSLGKENPFSHEHWNMTKQGEIYRADPKRAERLAAQAGTTVGGGRPRPQK